MTFVGLSRHKEVIDDGVGIPTAAGEATTGGGVSQLMPSRPEASGSFEEGSSGTFLASSHQTTCRGVNQDVLSRIFLQMFVCEEICQQADGLLGCSTQPGV